MSSNVLKITEDWHIHTFYSGCSNDPEQNPENIFKKATELGLKAIGFADHLWQNPDKTTWPKDLTETNAEIIEQLREDIKKVPVPDGLQVFLGAEAEMTGPNQFSITKDFADSLDFVLMPSNHIHLNFVQKPTIRTPETYIDFLLERFVSGAKSGLATIMAHPMIPYANMDLFAPGILNCPAQKMVDSFGEAADRNIFFELNQTYVKEENSADEAAVIKIIQCAKTAGCRFTFGSDAHHLRNFSTFLKMEKVAAAAGLVPEDIASVLEVVRKK